MSNYSDRKLLKFKCKNDLCGKEFESRESRSQFCSRSCASTYNGKNLTFMKEDKFREEASKRFKKMFAEHPEYRIAIEQSFKIGVASSKGKYKQNPKSILDLSKRTITKILKRMKIGCSVCGWNLAICDIHHIKGRKIPDPHSHSNLCFLCPNCHRLAHNDIIKSEELKSLDVTLSEDWVKYYYG